MSRFAIAFIGLIFVALIGIVTFSYLKLSGFEDKVASMDTKRIPILSDNKSGIKNNNRPLEEEWTRGLADESHNSFVYPALELSMNFDVSSLDNREEQFRVFLEELDSYKFFCLNQVLSTNGMNYAFYKNGKDLQLMISAKSEQYLNSVLEQLKRYEIQYKVHKI